MSLDEKDLQENDTLEEETLEQTEVEELDDEPDYDTLKAERDDLKKRVSEESAKKLHWKNKATKTAEAKKEPSSRFNKEESDLESRLERQDLRLDGYSIEEVDYLMKNGGKEAVKDKFVMAAIQKLREQDKAEKAVVSSKASGSNMLKGLTEEQIQNMSAAELEKKILAGK